MVINFSSTIISLPSPGSTGVRHVGDGALEPSVPLGSVILRGVSQGPLWDVPVHHVLGLGSGLHAADSELHHLYYQVCELVVSSFPRSSLLYMRADREAKRVDGVPLPRPVGIVVVVL